MLERLPSPPGSRHERAQLARAILTTRRRMRLFAAVYLISIVVLLGVVGWRAHADWTLWVALAIVALLALAFAQMMFTQGWAMRDLDEQLRTMGGWRVTGRAPNGDPVSFAGHMVYSNRADLGRLRQYVRVDLDACD
jgi:hypothetical protein